ncbi:acyl-CoA dehydrogenase [Kocuria rhizophila]|uniref:acyl-CoA dehydrogenase family protein n=2 Tax=Kocuria rhizophila TaxID=72000 RepID=UPI001EF6FDFA|nr:acyl-CoA dehydrogenase [Kocuria rhizophila]MCG7425490.1 acyl-CoA dehydrogenase family protein [Kocuria rhizophila]MCT1544846.1 acyl-CoA dehydrogenase family protein [Kocuria rhizophila]
MSTTQVSGTIPDTDRIEDLPEDGAAAPSALDTAELGKILLGRWPEARLAARKRAEDPRFHSQYNQSVEDQRNHTYEQLKLLADAGPQYLGMPESVGGAMSPGANLSAFEELVLADPSLQIKSGVQWGLFGSAVLNLGTEEHHEKWLPSILDLSMPGAFAMTEIGHGSDVASIGTTATYIPETDEFEIHTPFKAAWKDYLGNAAVHGRAATVFAQLIVNGTNHGVHCLYVPLRDENGEFLPGVGGEDDGRKGGLNGIDNGRLHFDHVRVPRTNLLNKYGDVDENGVYSSPIPSPGRRFFTMIGTLVQGRVSLDGAATIANQAALSIAVRYAEQRRQFTTDSDIEEQTLLDYQRHQRRLIPRIAETYAMTFAHQQLLDKFHEVFSGEDESDGNRQELETLAAAFKPMSTWSALDTLQECREACGGAGFIAKNRFVELRADLDVYVTFEGDNTILLQLVAKRLLNDYSAEFKNADVGVMARYVADRATEAGFNRSGLRKLTQAFSDTGDSRKSVNALRDPAAQRALLTDRVQTMIGDIADELRAAARKSRTEQAEAFNNNQNRLLEAARSHAQLLQWEAFTAGLEKIENPDTKRVLTWLRDLFGLSLIERDLAWYLSYGRLSMRRGRALESYINRLIARLRPYSLELVDAFGLSPELLRAEIGGTVEAERQKEAADYYRRLRASGKAPVKEPKPARDPGAQTRGNHG